MLFVRRPPAGGLPRGAEHTTYEAEALDIPPSPLRTRGEAERYRVHVATLPTSSVALHMSHQVTPHGASLES